ncbi:MAG: RDD family protein [Armatimonadota bacterium]|nr:RDD family protein [Armatimonadota bacterium]
MSRQVTIVTPENAEISYELAGVGSRMVACLLDTLIQAGAALLLAIPLLIAGVKGLLSGGAVSTLSGWILGGIIVAIFLIIWGYYITYETLRNGQTPGKRILRLRVVRESGHPIDFACAAVRNLMRYVDFLPFAYSVGVLSILFSPTYRRLGDYAAGTMVVRERFDSVTPTKDDTAKSEDVEVFDGDTSALSRDDCEAVKRFVERRRELPPEVQTDLARRMVAPILEKVEVQPDGELDHIEFLESLWRRLDEDRRRRAEFPLP